MEQIDIPIDEAYQIFGYNFGLIFSDSSYRSYLINDLQNYPKADKNSIDILIDLGTSGSGGINERDETPLGTIKTLLATTRFYGKKGEVQQIEFRLNKPRNVLHSAIQRWMSLGYNDRIERIGQIFHEQVLVPAAFYMPEKSPLHGSCIQMKNKTVIFGGTGGVGKTSLELEFCMGDQGIFVTDDMAVIDKKGMIFPNLNFPKIYAYNVIGFGDLEEQILKGRSLMDKMHWKIRSAFDLSKTRRRVSPKDLFGSYTAEPVAASHYYILNRTSVPKVEIGELNALEATKRSVEILMSEFRYLLNDEGGPVEIRRSDLSDKWTEVLNSAFNQMQCFEIRIPKDMDHKLFRVKLRELIMDDQHTGS